MSRHHSFLVLTVVWSLSLLAGAVAAAPSVQAILDKGKQLENAQKFEEALTLYKKGIQAHGHENLYLEAGSLLGKMQRYQEAEEVLNEALSKSADSVSLKNLLGLIKFRKGDKAGAKAVWESVLQSDSGNQFATTWLKRLDEPAAPAAPARVPSQSPADAGVPKMTTPASSATPTSADAPAAPPGAKLPLEEQKKLAVKLFEDMIATDRWELDTLISLHRQVIDKCPDTDQAEESCWRLSNLYLHGLKSPDFNACIEVLEHLIKTYPDSPLYEPARARLLMACKSAGQHEKVVAIFENLFKVHPQMDDDRQFVLWAVDFAQALEAVGRADEAKQWYSQALQRDPGDSLEARFARERLGMPQQEE